MPNSLINLKYKEQILKIILKNITTIAVEVFLFGSFAQNKARTSSDIDLCLKSDKKISYDIILKIKAELEESNIPFKVDLVDFNGVDEGFRQIAFKEMIKWH